MSAERALAVGSEFVRFVRNSEVLSPADEVEIAHLGRGSFRVRLLIILRDPATAATAALASLALMAADYVREKEGAFSEEVAKACIESGASKCAFRTPDAEFIIERSEMVAIEKVSAQRNRTAGGEKAFLAGSSSNFTNIPAGSTVKVDGILKNEPYPVSFLQPDGSVGRVDQIVSEDEPPFDEPILIEATATRGEHGGWADRGIRLIAWQRILNQSGELEAFTGSVFVGMNGYVLHTDEGERLEVDDISTGNELPTAEPLRVVARRLTKPVTEGLADGTIAVLSWTKQSTADRSQSSLGDGTISWNAAGGLIEEARLQKALGKVKGNEFFAIGHIRQGQGFAYFDSRNGESFRIDNPGAVKNIGTGEVAAVLDQKGSPLEDGSPRVSLVRYQTASWNIDD